MNSIYNKFTAERSLFYILVLSIVVVIIIIVWLFIAFGTKGIRVTSPDGEEVWEIGQTYEITWASKKISKVGIVLFNGTEAEWIAKDVNANAGSYEWTVYPGHDYKDGFWIAVFEYPWRKDGEVDYSNGAFVITYPEFDNCDSLSISEEWPHIASDLPGARKVFITKNSYNGNLDGLDGADKICQAEAEVKGFDGEWVAFIGGEADEETAVNRLMNSSRGTDGIYIQADSSATLVRGATCHRLLGKTFDDFLAKFLSFEIVNESRIEEKFLENMGKIWLGRVNDSSKKNCITVTKSNINVREKYTFTVSCQNWTKGTEFVEGYPVSPGGSMSGFPTCYTPSGVLINSVATGAFVSGVTGTGDDATLTIYSGEYCNRRRQLLCIEN